MPRKKARWSTPDELMTYTSLEEFNELITEILALPPKSLQFPLKKKLKIRYFQLHLTLAEYQCTRKLNLKPPTKAERIRKAEVTEKILLQLRENFSDLDEGDELYVQHESESLFGPSLVDKLLDDNNFKLKKLRELPGSRPGPKDNYLLHGLVCEAASFFDDFNCVGKDARCFLRLDFVKGILEMAEPRTKFTPESVDQLIKESMGPAPVVVSNVRPGKQPSLNLHSYFQKLR